MVLAFVAPVIIAVYTRGTDECTGIRIHMPGSVYCLNRTPRIPTISSSLTSAEMNVFLPASGNLKQSLGLYLSDGLIEILAFAVERAEQFAVPVDEKFITVALHNRRIRKKAELWTTTIGEVSYSADSASR